MPRLTGREQAVVTALFAKSGAPRARLGGALLYSPYTRGLPFFCQCYWEVTAVGGGWVRTTAVKWLFFRLVAFGVGITSDVGFV
jgi:hypothetical protein